MDIFLSIYFFGGLTAAFALTCLCIFLPSKIVAFDDTEAYGAKILSDNVITGIKSVVVLSLTWFAMLRLSGEEKNSLFELFGRQQTLELLGIATFFVTVLMLFGTLYGVAKHQTESKQVHEKSISNSVIKVMSLVPALMALGAASIHIYDFGYIGAFADWVME